MIDTQLIKKNLLDVFLIKPATKEKTADFSWSWLSGKELFEPMTTYKTSNEQIEYIDIDAIDNIYNRVRNIKVVNAKEAPSRAKRFLKQSDVLFSMVRPYLRNIALVPDKKKFQQVGSTGFFVCRAKPHIAIQKYIYYLMLTPYVVDGLNEKMKGDNSPSIRKEDVLNFDFPLPPLEEQKRIVAKIEELFAKIDEIDKAQKELKELAELAEKKVLDMAVRGELVEQDETEGSGNEELNAIEAYLLDNKLLDKKRLNLTVTVDEPFPIPSTWVWTKIGFVTNYADKKEKATERIHLPTKLIDMENIVKDTGEFIDVTNVADISNLADRVVFHKSDVLYGRLRPYLRKIAVAKYDGICSPEIVPFRGYFHVDSEYLCAVMRSGYISSAVNLAMHGVNMPRASKELIQNLAFPLPPYFEQVRISNAVKAFVENIRLLY